MTNSLDNPSRREALAVVAAGVAAAALVVEPEPAPETALVEAVQHIPPEALPIRRLTDEEMSAILRFGR